MSIKGAIWDSGARSVVKSSGEGGEGAVKWEMEH